MFQKNSCSNDEILFKRDNIQQEIFIHLYWPLFVIIVQEMFDIYVFIKMKGYFGILSFQNM